jgi:hypothetical protein
MADQNGTPAAAQPAQAAAQPAQAPSFSVPEGYQLTPKSDIERYSRYEQQVRGFEPMYQKLTKAGIKTAEDFDRYAPAIDTLNKRKMDPKAFASMFSDEAEADLNPGKQPQSIDIDALRKQMRDEALDALYEDQHEQSRKGDDKMVDVALNKVLGDGEHDEIAKEEAKWKVLGWLEANRDTYPEGHRLHGKKLAPISQDLVDKAAKHFADLATRRKALSMNEVATAANGSASQPKKVGTVAGGGNTPPGKPSNNATEWRAGGLPPRAAAEAAAARRAESRRR